MVYESGLFEGGKNSACNGERSADRLDRSQHVVLSRTGICTSVKLVSLRKSGKGNVKFTLEQPTKAQRATYIYRSTL